MKNAFAALFVLTSVASAHMIMKTPAPALNPNNSPLLADGSDFPCKIPGGSGTIPDTNKNVITVGSSQTLSFTGSAVHGGGSCQVSMAKGNTVSKSTKWMVIHSIEGGCPANVAGNLPADPSGSGASTFQFSVPDHPDLPPGTYTLAWTWNNKIGNREMYMNCAYVDLQAAKKKRYMPTMPQSKRADAPLPAMFVANIGNGCQVPENIDVQYPDPGASVQIVPGSALGAPVGNCGASGAQPPAGAASSAADSSPTGAASSAGGFSPTGSSPSGAASNTVKPISSAGAGGSAPSGAGGFGSGRPSGTAAPGGQQTQTQGGSFVTASAPAAGAQSSGASAPSAPAASVPAASVPAASAPAASAPSAPVAAPSSGSAAPAPGSSTSAASCTGDGNWLCAPGGASFQRCASGSWSAPISMAAGTACVPATDPKNGDATLVYASSVGTHAKRDMRSHIARRAHNIHGSFVS